MAIGDVVSGISAAITVMTYQPATGVEVAIKSILLSDNHQNYVAITDGSNECAFSTITYTNTNLGNTSIMINNTRYLKILALLAGKSGYTGIQTK